MIGQIAAVTTHMRVGSGGVMLPNHAPLMVAERFKVLEGLFPGRIDLGLGRAPGTDPVTSYALRRRQDDGGDDDFLERFQELMLFESNALSGGPSVPQRARDAGRRAAAADLAARLERLQRAARRAWSAPASRSRIISPIYDPVAAMLSYREQFKPSPARDKPHAILARARRSAPTPTRRPSGSPPRVDLNFARRAPRRIPAAREPGGGAAYPYSPADRERIRAAPRPAVRRQPGDGVGAARRR